VLEELGALAEDDASPGSDLTVAFVGGPCPALGAEAAHERARALVGAWIGRRWRSRWYAARIVETEAYVGPKDRASHSWAGRRTARVEPMYADGGHLYVFLVYGMHYCANVVTRREGVPEAVLLRAADGPEGAPRLLSGPGKLCSALGITTADSGLDLAGDSAVRILLPARRTRRRLGISARIGIDYAGTATDWPLRFYDQDSDAISSFPRPRNISSRRE